MKWPFIDPSKWQKASYGKITITKILNSKSIYIAAWLQESSTGQLNSQLKTICWKFIKKKKQQQQKQQQQQQKITSNTKSYDKRQTFLLKRLLSHQIPHVEVFHCRDFGKCSIFFLFLSFSGVNIKCR